MKSIRSWKKAFEADLSYIAYEIKSIVSDKAIIVLEGDLGVGKTTFSKVFIDNDQTMSPTYSVLSETKDVLHGDFYRIKEREEIIHLELGLYLEDKRFFLVEWGKDYLENIMSECSEDFQAYLLQISFSSDQKNVDNLTARNFEFFKISDI